MITAALKAFVIIVAAVAIVVLWVILDSIHVSAGWLILMFVLMFLLFLPDK